MGKSAVLMADDGNEDYIACELCRETLQDLSVADRQAHYEAHFNNGDGLEVSELDAQLAVSLAQEASPNRRGAPPSRQNSIQHVPGGPKPRETVFWHPACSSPPPSRIMTPGIIPLLDRALDRPGSRGGALCVPLISHFGTELWDLGWGCGYRNFLMACSALAAQDARPEYRDLLMNDPCGPPGVRNLQLWIEDAWRHGYDSHGAAQLRNRLVGTRKWIGTAELYVALTSRGIPARLVDFPKNGYAHVALIQWLTAYFTESSNHLSSGSEAAPGVYMSSKMPVVLQHRGHSRTVVGLEFTQSGETNVLIYDPAWRPGASLRKAALKVHAASFSPSGSNTSSESEPHHPRRHSPTKAKEFFKRVIKRRSRTPVDEQASKRVRGGSVEPDDWVTAGEEKGQSLGEPVAQDQKNKDSSFRRKASTGTVDEDSGRQLYQVPPDATQGLDLGRVLSTFRVTLSQLSKKDQYQVLWFPMTAPLTESEREACKVVRSERITISPAPKQ